MSRKMFCLMVSSALALQPSLLSAAEPVKPAVPSGPSAFVRCDGSPNKASTLGTVARLIAITAVIGLFLPQPEAADPKKRQSGQDGIKACDDALTGATPAKDGGRRIELFFGRSIHNMEVGNWDAAIADIRAAETDQPDLVKTTAYQQSLGLTAMSLEAMALVGKGNYAGAQALSLKKAQAAPYDLSNMLEVTSYQSFGPDYGPEKAAYYDQLVRMYPLGLADRGGQLALARRFSDAAADYATLAALIDTMPDASGYSFAARGAIAERLAGKGADADRVIEQARQLADKDQAAGKNNAGATATAEAADLYAILKTLDDGNAVRARTLFSARTRWNAMPIGLVAEVSRRLANAGTPADRTRDPIVSADDLLRADRDRMAAIINDPGKDNQDRFRTYRAAFSPKEFNRFAGNVWKTDKSKYIDLKTTEKFKDKIASTVISTSRDGYGVPAGYAMLLHLALVAKAQGAEGFQFMPAQKYTYMGFYRMGKKGEAGLFAPVMFDADKVIADLGPLIPRPVAK